MTRALHPSDLRHAAPARDPGAPSAPSWPLPPGGVGACEGAVPRFLRAARPRRLHRLDPSDPEALAALPAASLDWIHLGHGPGIERRLDLARAKVRPGGAIMGRGYDRRDADGRQPVRAAVRRLIAWLGGDASLDVAGGAYLIRLHPPA